MVFNATFNNISIISWRSVLLTEETGKPPTYRKSLINLSQNVVSSTPHHQRDSNSKLLRDLRKIAKCIIY
jgi:hypothetical protein